MKQIDDGLKFEVGRIAVALGQIRFTLLSAGDQLVATRLGDQGIVRLLLNKKDWKDTCLALTDLATIKGLSKEAIDIPRKLADDFGGDESFANDIINGSWSYMGGDAPRIYGLFEGEESNEGDLRPKWRKLHEKDLRELSGRLELAFTYAEEFLRYCRLNSGINRPKNIEG